MKTQGSFLSTDAKTTIHTVKWAPDDGACRAVLQLVHGMVEYTLRYADFAEFLAARGFVVVGHDHLGHGDSVSSREDWGYFAPEHPSRVLVEDMHKLRELTQQEYPGLPYFILGHSMGSYLLREYLAVHAQGLAGAILSGTGYVAPGTCAMAQTICKVLAAFRGWRHRSKLVSSLTFGKSYRQFDMSGKHPENSWLTKDTAIVEGYYRDPKCTFAFTLNGYLGLFEAVGFDCRQENVDKIPKNLPVLIASGSDDPVGDLGAGVEKVHRMFQTAGIADLTCTLYPGDRHEILNELDRDQVYSDILDWMQARM